MVRKVVAIAVALTVTWAASGAASAKEWPSKAPSDHDRGRELYVRHCLACHGPKGAGDGPLAIALGGAVPDLHEGYGKRPFDDLVRVTLRGKGAMPAFEVAFDKADAERVVRYLGKLGQSDEEAKVDEPDADEGGADEDDDADVGGG